MDAFRVPTAPALVPDLPCIVYAPLHDAPAHLQPDNILTGWMFFQACAATFASSPAWNTQAFCLSISSWLNCQVARSATF